MTLREQIGQLFMLGFSGTSVSPELASLLSDYMPGGVILFSRNLEHVAQIVGLTNELQQRSAHARLLIAIDQEGGRVSRLPAGFTIFPSSETVGCCRSAELAHAAAATTAAELRAVGINMNMAPVLDVNTNRSNPVIGDRAFGADPDLVSELGVATLKGLQDKGVVACGKHFPGHGDTSTDSHKELPAVNVSADLLRGRELRPFRHAIEHGVAAIMTAHVLYPALDHMQPATLSSVILTDLLRGQLGFTGVTITDDLEMQAILDHHGIQDAAVSAFLAGADILLICKDATRQVAAMNAVHDAVNDGTISQERLRASLQRIAQVKRRFLHAYEPADPGVAQLVVGCRTHHALLETIRRTSERVLKTQV